MKRRPAVDVPRDRWGRPLIDGTAYTRASTLAKALDDDTALTKWKLRMAVLGLSRNPDLVALASTTQPDDKNALDDIVEKAQEFAGSARGRNTGTSIHAASEMVDCGEDVSHLPPHVLWDALAYQNACEVSGLTPVLAETFVINEALGAAGTFDRLLWDDLGQDYVVGDIKTGNKSDPAYALSRQGLSWASQLAIYAYGHPWNGQQLHWADLDVQRPDRTRGVIFYIPRGSAQCHPIWLNLKVGYEAALLASHVRTIRKAKVAL